MANPMFALLPVAIMVVDRIWMAWKWRMLLNTLKPVLSLLDAIKVYYTSSFQGSLLPFGGIGPDIIRYTYLRSRDVSPPAVAASIFMERILGLLATMSVIIMSTLLLLSELEHELFNTFLGIAWGAGAFAIVCAAILFHPLPQKWLYNGVTRTWIFKKFKGVNQFVELLRKYQNHHDVLLYNYLLCVIEQFFPVLQFYLGFRMFDISVGILDCMIAIPIGMVMERLPISYSGAGVREGTLILVFGLLGYAYDDVLVVSSVMFILYLLSLLPGAAWSLTGIRPKSS